MGVEKKQIGPDPSVPQDRQMRHSLEEAAVSLVCRRKLSPPLSLNDLRRLATEILVTIPGSEAFENYAITALHNAVWCDTFSRIPFERRILLLPPCLRDATKCSSTSDALGRVCAGCGACPITGLSEHAEALGYTVMIADSSDVAHDLIKEGLIEAVLGVSCMETLEKMFTEMDREVIPGLAVPLLRCGCEATTVDVERVASLLEVQSPQPAPISVKKTNEKVRELFAHTHKLRQENPSATGQIAAAYLAESGKRWRPTLLLAVYETLAESSDIPAGVETLAIAIECFHKASLIHDDIEDGATLREAQPTLHIRYNTAVAINTGDYLLGEGYRLISQCGFSPDAVTQILNFVADGHRELSAGQGEELLTHPTQPSQLIEIFRQKTSPAFRIPILLGIICAAETARFEPEFISFLLKVASRYSEALGIAYQIYDNMRDLDAPLPDAPALLDKYRQETLDSLSSLPHAGLKILLSRITSHLLLK